MFNQELFNKICKVSCGEEELRAFVHTINRQEFDLENAFEKYYSIACILSAIRKYKEREINDEFLAYWANAYNWILMSGFKISSYSSKGNRTTKEVIIDEISEWLDSLSFFDDEEDFYDINEYVDVFTTLDEIYQNEEELRTVYETTNEFCEEDGDAWIAFINDNKRRYLVIHHEGCGRYRVNNQETLKEGEMVGVIKSLKESGYQKFPYSKWAEENGL